MINQGKLLKTLTYLWLSFLRAYPGWSLKSMAQNYQNLFLSFLSHGKCLLCIGAIIWLLKYLVIFSFMCHTTWLHFWKHQPYIFSIQRKYKGRLVLEYIRKFKKAEFKICSGYKVWIEKVRSKRAQSRLEHIFRCEDVKWHILIVFC